MLGINDSDELCAEVRVGESLVLYADFPDDLRGASFTTAFRHGRSSDSDAVENVALAIAVSDARRGIVKVSLGPTKLLEPKTYYGEIRAELANGQVDTIRLEVNMLPTLFAA